MRQKLRSQLAFTLVELLVVITIIGLISGVMVLSVNTVKQEDVPEAWFKQFAKQVDYAQDAAVLSNKNFAIQFNQVQYRFLIYQKGQWTVYDKEVLSPKTNKFPESATVNIHIRDKRFPLVSDFKSITPHILIYNTSTMTPFELHLHYSEGSSKISYGLSGKTVNAQ